MVIPFAKMKGLGDLTLAVCSNYGFAYNVRLVLWEVRRKC